MRFDVDIRIGLACLQRMRNDREKSRRIPSSNERIIDGGVTELWYGQGLGGNENLQVEREEVRSN